MLLIGVLSIMTVVPVGADNTMQQEHGDNNSPITFEVNEDSFESDITLDSHNAIEEEQENEEMLQTEIFTADESINTQETDEAVIIQKGWVKTGSNWNYFKDNGNEAIGWNKINGRWYYFNDDGIMATGWLTFNGKKYYFKGGDDGSMVIGWNKISNNWYYFHGGNNGSMATGWNKVNNKWYYLDKENNGIMSTGWIQVKNKWYYLNGGDDGSMRTGWFKHNNNWYYLKPVNDGSAATGWNKINNKWYYLDEENNGIMSTGWVQVKNKWYYLNGGDDGSMKTGWFKYNNNWYYLKPVNDGSMAVGWLQIGKTWYYLRPSGAMHAGWLTEANREYYLKPGSGAMATGWSRIGKNDYYFNSSGIRTEINMPVPVDYQWRYHHIAYGPWNVAGMGCGIVSTTMYLKYLTGQNISVSYMTSIAQSHVEQKLGYGAIKESFFDAAGGRYGYKTVITTDPEEVRVQLQSGNPVMVLRSSSITGHWQVIRGITADGKQIRLNNPNDSSNDNGKYWNFDNHVGKNSIKIKYAYFIKK